MDKEIKLVGIRKIIAKRMRESLDTAAQATQTIRVDMSKLMEERAKLNSAGTGVKISVTDILTKAVADTIKKHPGINSSLIEDKIIQYEAINIGIAVALPEGLVVPVIKNCTEKTINEISGDIKSLSEKAKTRKLMTTDITGGTFTISNLGMTGIESFTAIINPPESAILAIGTTIKTPVVDENNNIVVKPLSTLTITYDHRVLDGEPVARFMTDLKQTIENIEF